MTLVIFRLTNISFRGDKPCENDSGSSEKALQNPLCLASADILTSRDPTDLILSAIQADCKLLLTAMRDPFAVQTSS